MSIEVPRRQSGVIELGHINGAYGVKGWVKVFSLTRPMDSILEYPIWQLQTRTGNGNQISVEVLQGRRQGKGIVARISACDDRDQAAALRGARITVNADQLAALDEGDYYWRDLVGLAVQNRQGVDFGRVISLMETGNNDVLVVKGDRERLIPYLPGNSVIDVDLAGGRMVVDWDAEF